MRGATRVLAMAAVVCAGFFSAPLPSAAQQPAGSRPAGAGVQTPRSPSAPASQARIGFRAFFLAEQQMMTAADSFDAVVDSSSFVAFGGGGEVLRLWRGLFARVAYSDTERDGQRVVIFEDAPVRLGIPLTVRMSPLEAGGGWRADLGRARAFGVYGGGGLLRVRYRETSEFALADENVDDTFNGYLIFGGVDVTIARWIMVGVEGQYRTVPDALGNRGVSAVFNETDLGGASLRIMVGAKR